MDLATMTSRIRWTSLAAAGAMIAAACGDGGADALRAAPGAIGTWTGDPWCEDVMAQVGDFLASTPAPDGPEYGGVAVVRSNRDLTGMSVASTNGFEERHHQTFVQFVAPLRYDEDLELQPGLAESWSFSEDRSELTFTIRDDVLWHDGTPTTAQDMAFTYERLVDPATGFSNSAFFQRYTGVEVVDDRTVRFSMEPHADPLDPWTATVLLPRHLLEDVPAGQLAEHPFNTTCPVGNGPFVFQGRRGDQDWTFVRNNAFPEGLGGPPHLDAYVLRVIPDEGTATSELLAGGIDVFAGTSPDAAQSLVGTEGLTVAASSSRSFRLVGWNTRRPVLSDPVVRRSIARGFDRQSIIDEVLHGYGTLANAGVPPSAYGYEAALEDSLRYDPERARAELDAAGWIDADGDGVRERNGEELRIELLWPSSVQQYGIYAQIMQSQLADVGIEVTPVAIEGVTMFGRVLDVEARDFDGFMLEYTPEFNVDDHDLFHSEAADGQYAWSGLDDPEVDRLIDALSVEPDPEARAELWSEYQHHIANLAPYTWLFFSDRITAYSTRIEGVEVGPRSVWATVQDWRIPPANRRYRPVLD